jgi:hypothetical protein
MSLRILFGEAPAHRLCESRRTIDNPGYASANKASILLSCTARDGPAQLSALRGASKLADSSSIASMQRAADSDGLTLSPESE